MKIMKRQILNDVLSPIPDKPLYHYTNQKGLLGVIKSRTIWMTHTQYLNDRREFLHAVDLVRTEIKRLQKAELDSSKDQILLRMEQVLDLSPEGINVCVCSFSEEPDSLSQWRAYGAPGFAVGFPSMFLKDVAAKRDWYLVRCVYDPAHQREIVQALVDEVLEENLSPVEPDDDPDDLELRIRLGGNLLPYINRYAPLLKDESFKEEHEWRIISCPLSSSHASFDFREGKSLLIPYYKLDLADGHGRFPIHQITVGPTRDEERSIRSVRNFLMHEDLRKERKGDIPVQASKVPYRDW